ncbi:MAG TPA: hypothetical protein PLG20_08345 [Candidatus Syntrophosphaera sp.]|nr:hypothetical protein [Candidatus Syntrophosphaera sp.]
MKSKIQFDLQPVRHKEPEVQPRENKQNRRYVTEILEAMGWLTPQATPEPRFSEPEAAPKVERIKVKIKGKK